MSFLISSSKLLITKAMLLLIFFTYFPGIVLYYFFPNAYHSYYTYDGEAFSSLVITLILLLPIMILFQCVSSKISSYRARVLNPKLVVSFFLFVVIVYNFASLYFFINYDISFRHRNRLSDAGGIIIVLFFLRYLALFYLMLCLAKVLRGEKLKKVQRSTLILFCLGWLLSINSSLQVIYVFACILVLYGNNFLIQDITLKKIVILGTIAPLVLFGVLIVGIGNKVGLEFLFSDEGVTFFYGYLSTIAARVSTSLYSLAYAFDTHTWDVETFLKLASYELQTLTNRIGMLLPLWDVDKESITTVSRYNYLHAMENQADRGGSTPGILASIYYGGGLPIGLMLISLYLTIILNSLSNIFEGVKSYSLPAIVIVSYLVLPFFENPLSFLNAIQPPVLYLICIVLVGKMIKL
ncbi:hypothetical protein [Vibrio chagasii]|uniref:hypothetical protein n=1 Tax=Vibrio chagasii TaxID=170679 RepID=UPI00228399B3|nr:hypothetical protein [Vibrio chagasii]MCY9826433.1 hypothetical protein [Vibrio chagasii]